jgi:hypothetical protein
MKAFVTLPLEIYKLLLGRCSMLSREYLILKNGIIQQPEGSADGAMVEILCEVQRAKFLFDFATLVCPEAAAHIEKGIIEAGQEAIEADNPNQNR